MKPKNAIILLAIVAALIGAIAIYELGIKPSGEEKEKKDLLLFPDLDLESADAIEIKSGDTAVTLVKAGDTAWAIQGDGFNADPDAVQKALDKLKELKAANVTSRSKDSHADLGVDEKGTQVKAKAGDKTLAALVVGEQGTSYATSFVRKLDSDDVYMIYDNVKNVFTAKPETWRDKRIFGAELDEVVEITLYQRPESQEGDTGAAAADGDTAEKGPADYVESHFKKNDKDEWVKVEEGTTAETAFPEADSIARALATMRASGFDDKIGLKDAGLDPPSKKAAFKLKDGRTYALHVGKEEESKYFVSRPDKGKVLLVYRYNVSNAFKDKKEEKKEAPGMGFDPGSLLPPPSLGPENE